VAGRFRLAVMLVVIGMVGVACGDDTTIVDAATTTVAGGSTTAGVTTTTIKVPDTAETTTTAAGTTTTKAPEPTTTGATTTTTAASTTTAGATTTTTSPIATTTTVATIFDLLAEPTYGTETVTSGFSPDPLTTPVTSGGVVHATYLGGDCVGWAAISEDHEFRYTAGAYSLLRFYFIADDSADTVMIINDPDGAWWCGDDSFGTRAPTIDFTSPISGTYDIWVGSYSEGTYHSGTLYVTELASNHP
jgi:hypothetical protein